jgi:mRNA-degrading endonuclease toxin of MazEF toxin-antitoxin module
MSAPKFQRGDVVWCLMPFADRSGTSRRRVLVVGDPLSNINRDYVVIQITSTQWHGPTDLIVVDSHPEFKATGLDPSSTFRCHKISPIGETCVQKRAGQVGPSIMREVEARLRIALSL